MTQTEPATDQTTTPVMRTGHFYVETAITVEMAEDQAAMQFIKKRHMQSVMLELQRHIDDARTYTVQIGKTQFFSYREKDWISGPSENQLYTTVRVMIQNPAEAQVGDWVAVSFDPHVLYFEELKKADGDYETVAFADLEVHLAPFKRGYFQTYRKGKYGWQRVK